MALPATADEIWPYIEKWPFAVVGFVTPGGEPRAAGVMYKVKDRELYVVTGPDTWKAKHIKATPNVVVTVTVQRLPIRIRQAPPAVITFPGDATVVPIGEVDADLQADLLRGVDHMEDEMCVIRIRPTGRFVTYGIGVPLMKMRNPEASIARVPVV